MPEIPHADQRELFSQAWHSGPEQPFGNERTGHPHPRTDY